MILPAYISFLIDTPLFSDIEYDEAEALLECLDAEVAFYHAGEEILTPYMQNEYCFVVLSGQARRIRQSDAENHEGELLLGELFLPSSAVLGTAETGVTLIAAEHTTMLKFLYKDIPAFCEKACTPHKLLIDNLFRLLISQRDSICTHNVVLKKRSIREKIMEFLYLQQSITGEKSFAIPYNREELSEHLGVDRSALSRELSKLRGEGVIEFKKNEFTLLDTLKV